MADRWVSSPHVFPNCCHRCLRSGEEHGPYFHEEWNYCQPDRWPGVTPDAPRVARKFTCKSCLQNALNAEGAPVFDEAALAKAEAQIQDLKEDLELATTELQQPVQYLDLESVVELLESKKPAPRTRKKAA